MGRESKAKQKRRANPTPAKRYLRFLQSQVSDRFHSELSQDYIRHRSRQLKGLDPSAIKEALGADFSVEGREELLRKEFVLPLLRLLGASERSKLLNIPVGFLPIYDPNAWTILIDNGRDHLIVIHTELLSALSFHYEVSMASTIYGGEKGRKLFSDGMTYLLRVFKGEREDDYPMVDVKLEPEQYYTILGMSCAAELFIIAHEFAHASLGHVADTKKRALGLRDDLIAEKYEWRRQQELDADLQAFKWIMGLKKKQHLSPALWLVSMNPVLAVQVLMFFHFVETRLGYPKDTDDHPPSLQRLEHIANNAKSILSTQEQATIYRWIDQGKFMKEHPDIL